MMSGMPLETCWTFNKRWNNKFYYKIASCWSFLLIHTKMHGSTNIKLLPSAVDEGEWLASWPDFFNLQKEVPVPIRWDANWTPKFWGRDGQEKPLHSRWKSDFTCSFFRSFYSTVTILTELHNGIAPETAWVPTLFSSVPPSRKQPAQLRKYKD
jgi:hypothetical protein